MPSNPRPRSAEIFRRSEKILVGGVDSPVRAFRAVGGSPLVIERAEGARLYDADGNEYLDYVCSWGAMILGHAHPSVTKAIQDQAAYGTSYGMTSPLESELAGANRERGAVNRDDALRQLGHRGDDVRSSPGARIHETRPRREIRGLLSRAFGQLSFAGGLGLGDARDFGEPWGTRSIREINDQCAVQRSRGCRESVRVHTRARLRP